MGLKPEDLSSMTPQQEKMFWKQFEDALENDSGEAAQAHLAAGKPIYYEDDSHPGKTIKEYPDGRRQIVRFEPPSGKEIVVQDL